MDYVNIFIDLVEKNWQNILIALSITIGVGFFFFILTPWGIKKFLKTAEVERRKRASENILDLLESSLILKQDMDSRKILHLLSAIGRENEVDVSSYYPIKSLLEDLELRFEKSKHLDSAQKLDYTRKIESMIDDFEKKEKDIELTIPYKDLFEELEQNINEGNKEVALKKIDIIKEKLIYKYNDYTIYEAVLSEYFRIFKKILHLPNWLKLLIIIMYFIIIYLLSILLKLL